MPPRHTSDRSIDGAASTFGLEDENMSANERPLDFQLDAEYFARELDRSALQLAKPSNRRDVLFGLADTYYQYAKEQAEDQLAKRKRRKPHSRAPKSSSRHGPGHEAGQDAMEVDEEAEEHRQDDDATDDDALGELSMDEAEEHRQDGDATGQTATNWRLEAQTWDLLRRILPLRYAERGADGVKPQESTNSDLWEDFILSDSLARERKAILEWLQQSADETRSEIDDIVSGLHRKAERGDILAFGWLHTRSTIKMQKSVAGWSGALDPSVDVQANGKPLVTQLDPDVMTRQPDRRLQDADTYFERAIWLGCFELLRRGRSTAEIRNWCVERTEVWRAVSMSAIPLSREQEGQRTIAKPLATLLWRRTCFALARQGGMDDYERAVYGILSGDVSSVEKVCKSWDDFVFTHYNALLRTQFDDYVMNKSRPEVKQAVTQSLPAFDAVRLHGPADSAGERLFQSLETNPNTAGEAKTPMKALQAAIICDTVSQYVHDNGLFLGRAAAATNASALIRNLDIQNHGSDESTYFGLKDHSGLRVLVHVHLLISLLDELQKPDGDDDDAETREAQENAIASYIIALQSHDLVALLPLYCARLPEERGFDTLSFCVADVVDGAERTQVLTLMEKYDMDIAKFVVFQPKKLLEDYPLNVDDLASRGLSVFTDETPSAKFGRRLKPDFWGDEPEALDTVDDSLIESLGWMALVDGLWDEIFSIGVTIYKRFLRQFNFFAARRLADRMKCADIFKWKADASIPNATDLTWFSHFEENPPLDEDGSPRQMVTARNFLEMESLVRALDCMETVASSAGIIHTEGTSRDASTREFWDHLSSQVKTLKMLMPIFKGWLKNTLEEDPDLDFLRDAYLPEMVLGFVSVLHFAGTSLSRDNFLECMEFAALIAEKDSDLATSLVKTGRMEELIRAFAIASKAMAISAADKKNGGGGSSRRTRELGWSRELWTIRR